MSTTVYSICPRSMTNALHLEFHQAYLRYLTEHTPAALGLASALVDSYRKKISDEQALVNRTFVSPYTAAIKTAHLARARARSVISWPSSATPA